MLFNFEVPLKKYQKKLQQKIEKNKQQQKRGFVCVFFCFCGGAL
jgi:hypothetical protein